LLFSFPSSSTFHSVLLLLQHVLRVHICMFMLVFEYTFTFCHYLPHMRENMWLLYLWKQVI
jgi:hypothetical protein